MEEVKRIPYGVSNFVEVVEQNQYYVDKTMYLPLLEKQPSNLFFIRPRRFGKSIFLSMLRTYYDIAQKEKFEKRFSQAKLFNTMILGGYLKVRPVVAMENVMVGLKKSLPERAWKMLPANEEAIRHGGEIIRKR